MVAIILVIAGFLPFSCGLAAGEGTPAAALISGAFAFIAHTA